MMESTMKDVPQVVEKVSAEERTHLGPIGRVPSSSFLFIPQGSADTAAGIFVDEETALTFGAVWAAVRVVSETIATLPAKVYRRIDDDERERQRDSQVEHIVLREPNPDMTPASMFQTLTAHLMLWGNAFAEIELSGAMRPLALHPIHPRRVIVKRSAETGRLIYEILPSNDGTGPHRTGGVVLTADEMLHVPGLSFNGLVGLSPIRVAAKQAISIGLSAEAYGAKLFANDSTPSGILKTPHRLDDEEAVKRLRKSWEDIHKGTDNAHKLAILEEGLEWEAIGIPPEDAQFLQTRKFQVTDIARIFRVPPHKIGDLEKATFSNIEEMNLEFSQDSIRPWLVKFEQEMNRKFFRTHEFFVEFDMRALLRADVETRFKSYKDGFGIGAFSVNDILRLENQNPIGPAGDQRFIPMNMAPLPQAALGRSDDGDALDPLLQRIADSVAPLVADALGRARVAEGEKLTRLFKGFRGNGDTERLGYELDVLKRASRERMERLAMPCIATMAKLLGCPAPTEPPAQFRAWIARAAGFWTGDTLCLPEWIQEAPWKRSITPEDKAAIDIMLAATQNELQGADPDAA